MVGVDVVDVVGCDGMVNDGVDDDCTFRLRVLSDHILDHFGVHPLIGVIEVLGVWNHIGIHIRRRKGSWAVVASVGEGNEVLVEVVGRSGRRDSGLIEGHSCCQIRDSENHDWAHSEILCLL